MIVYYSGTGNSKYVADMLADLLDDEAFCATEYIKGESAAERVIASYSKDVCLPTGAADKSVVLVNATGEDGLLVEFVAPATVAFFDVCGVAGGTIEAERGLCRLPVPKSGFAQVTWRR